MLIGAFVFIILDPVLVLVLANALSASAAESALNYSNISFGAAFAWKNLKKGG